jgi:hypothetical protein
VRNEGRVARAAAAFAMGIILHGVADILNIQCPATRTTFMVIGALVAVPFILWLTGPKDKGE